MTATLAEVEREALACTRCPLHRGRTNVVFGVGNPTSDLMFVGEGPGEQEDRQGEPFVGRSGQLLDRLILEEMGLTRKDLYICNVVKCRPPSNRDPLPEEIAACRPFLVSQVKLIDPRVIVTLGNFASKLMLGTTEGITKIRGRTYPLDGRSAWPERSGRSAWPERSGRSAWPERSGRSAWPERPDRVVVPTFHPAAVLRGGGEAMAQMRADLVRAGQLLPKRSGTKSG